MKEPTTQPEDRTAGSTGQRPPSAQPTSPRAGWVSHSLWRPRSKGRKSLTSCPWAISRSLYTQCCTHSHSRVPGTGPHVLQTGSGMHSDAQGLPWASLPRLLEKQGPPPKAINHPKGSLSRQHLLEGELAGVCRLGEGLRVYPQGAGHGPLAHTLPWGPLPFPWALPYPGPGQGKAGRAGRPPQDLGGLPGPSETIYTSGPSPTEQCVFKPLLPK